MNNETNTKMETVTLEMTDALNNKVSREIDITNAMDCMMDGFFLGSKESQRINLEDWIADRGNEQHDTTLQLVSWTLA